MSNTPPRIVTIGEAMLQVTPAPLGPLARASTASLSVAGAESTVASYLAMLGHHTIWLSAVGDDPIGERIVSEIRSKGVYTALVARDASAQSGVYFKDPSPSKSTTVYYYRSGSAASRMGPESIGDFVFYRKDLVHMTGITPALSTSCHRLVEAAMRGARAADGVVSFDVNYRPALWSVADAAEILRTLANQADIVFVGLDEAEELWGTSEPDAIRKLLPKPMTVIVKDSSVEATAFDGPTKVAEPARTVDVVEPVGAGDAFAAGFLHGVLIGADLRSSLQYGHALAGSSLGTVGDLGPLPTELQPAGKAPR